MTEQEIRKVFSSFNDKKVLLIGDAMIDAYMWGKVERMSPEAPVPIVEIDKHEIRLGGSANCALNIKSLGANPILCTVIGDDINGIKFEKLMKDSNLSTDGVLIVDDRKTTIKTRIISEGKHQLRVDEEDTHHIKTENQFINKVDSLLENASIIILQDYNKGVLTKKIIRTVINKAKERGIPTIVDPKKDNFLEYQECDIFKPNLKEIKEGINIKFDESKDEELQKATSLLKEKLNAKAILLTLSGKGICINSEEGFIHTPAYGGNVVDVSGAGDTVISVASLLLAAGVSSENISKISSLSGGIVCQKVGVVPIDKKELLLETIKIF
ncbi:MAG: bifunctional heptose 7-phosphate kinase/heptose 1-phosphate adenyltransferase [Flavobacteriales bacterium]